MDLIRIQGCESLTSRASITNDSRRAGCDNSKSVSLIKAIRSPTHNVCLPFKSTHLRIGVGVL